MNRDQTRQACLTELNELLALRARLLSRDKACMRYQMLKKEARLAKPTAKQARRGLNPVEVTKSCRKAGFFLREDGYCRELIVSILLLVESFKQQQIDM